MFQIWSFFWSVFRLFRPSTGKYGPEKAPYLDSFHGGLLQVKCSFIYKLRERNTSILEIVSIDVLVMVKKLYPEGFMGSSNLKKSLKVLVSLRVFISRLLKSATTLKNLTLFAVSLKHSVFSSVVLRLYRLYILVKEKLCILVQNLHLCNY